VPLQSLSASAAVRAANPVTVEEMKPQAALLQSKQRPSALETNGGADDDGMYSVEHKTPFCQVESMRNSTVSTIENQAVRWFDLPDDWTVQLMDYKKEAEDTSAAPPHTAFMSGGGRRHRRRRRRSSDEREQTQCGPLMR
jgi:hypothetical protein